MADRAWYSDNSSYAIQAGCGKLPNAFGLCDTTGNVWEWTSDWFDPDYYAQSPKDDTHGPSTGTMRVLRGGGASTQGMMLPYSFRIASEPANKGEEYGFRLVREPAN